MLILPPGHAQTLRDRRRLSAREKWAVRGVAATVAAVLVAIAISFAVSSPTSSHGCINATIPGDVGAQQVSECGTTARATCATVFAPGAFTTQAASVVATACRKAGLPVGR